MNGYYSKWILRLALLMILPMVVSCDIYRETQALKQPKYEVGKHKGAKFCATCHQEIYAQWSKNSRHAVATTAKSFLDFKEQFTGKFMFNAMMGETMCYACHGIKEVNEGVNCETCHGPALPGTPIMETHQKKFSPGRLKMKGSDFCAKCHVMKNPMSGDFLMALYSEWENSEAAAKGVTCQGCHMKSRGGNRLYHGFDTAVRKEGIYDGDLAISKVTFDFPKLSMTIDNKVTGHSIPAGGPTRTLALEMSFKDAAGKEIYTITKTFAKKFELVPVLGLMPYKLIENTQLQSSEKRRLMFTLPSQLKGKVSSLKLVLRMYEVSDEYQGNIEKAHWVSQPIVNRNISLLEKSAKQANLSRN